MSKTCRHSIITDGCKACSRMQADWYSRLEGFDDAENSKYPDRPLKKWHSKALKRTRSFEIEGVRDYYTSATRFSSLYAFQNPTIERIWELHCEGLSRYEIEKEIHGQDISYKQSAIRNIIQDLNREMLDSSYTDDGIEDMIIITRDFDPEMDTGFLLESMGKSLYYDSNPRKGRPSPKWFSNFNEYFKEIMPYAQIFIATQRDDHNHILGYLITTPKTNHHQIEFVYVKDAYRKQGIATMLTKELDLTKYNKTNLTKLGAQIMKQKLEAVHADTQDQSEQSDAIAQLIKTGFPVKKASFQSAILSGFNAAETQLSKDSSNKLRVPDQMYYTQGGLVVIQNKQTILVPIPNIIQVCL